jgi:pilus assembly protein Flp/PilA
VRQLRVAAEDSESGASAAEYALLVAGVAALIVVIVFAFGGLVRNLNHDNCTTIATTASPSYDCGP